MYFFTLTLILQTGRKVDFKLGTGGANPYSLKILYALVERQDRLGLRQRYIIYHQTEFEKDTIQKDKTFSKLRNNSYEKTLDFYHLVFPIHLRSNGLYDQ